MIKNISIAIQISQELLINILTANNLFKMTEEHPHRENAYIAWLADTAERINTNQN